MTSPSNQQIQAQLRATLVEVLAKKARRNGALWQGHASLFGSQTTSLAQLIGSSAFIGNATVPVAQPSVDDLLFYAQCSSYDVTPVGSANDAYRLQGKHNSDCFGVDQLWVRVGSKQYRSRMFELWGDELHGASPSDHQAAASVFGECIRELLDNKVRAKLRESLRELLIAEMQKHLDAHAQAATQGASDPELMKDFDCMIDADHVYAKSALHEDAYVWIFPTPADANRRYGRLVERHYQKRKTQSDENGVESQSSATEYLSPGMAFKLLSGAMPARADEVDTVCEHVLGRLHGDEQNLKWLRTQLTAFAKQLKEQLR
jgi:hypothetical protein